MSKFSIKKSAYVVAEEDALEQFLSFLTFYEIDLDKIAEAFTKTDKAGEVSADDIGDGYIELIREGKISFETTPEGVVIDQYLNDSKGDIKLIRYNVLGGAQRKALGKETTNSVERQYNLLASLTGLTPKVFENLGTKDSAVALSVAGLFRMA